VSPTHSPPTRGAIAAISSRSTDDWRIRGLRSPKPRVDPWQAHGSIIEEERRPDGRIERALTVFLAGAECPFTCSFCDLWRWTLDGPTPPGALPTQLRRVLENLDNLDNLHRLKLYNASNFFDQRAVPPQDIPALATLAHAFTGVTVESHVNLIGTAVLDLSARIPGRLEVAVGLETIHPTAAAHLNKRMDLARFDHAAGFLELHDIDLRVFVLLGAPYVEPEGTVEWTVRTAEYAARFGAASIALIPVRGGNGELERLAALGHFTPPTLKQLEDALDACLGGRAAVAADLWNSDRLSTCADCREARIGRLRRVNLTGLREPRVTCASCGAA
jgi:archaeosine synthase beta-subunit